MSPPWTQLLPAGLGHSYPDSYPTGHGPTSLHTRSALPCYLHLAAYPGGSSAADVKSSDDTDDKRPAHPPSIEPSGEVHLAFLWNFLETFDIKSTFQNPVMYRLAREAFGRHVESAWSFLSSCTWIRWLGQRARQSSLVTRAIHAPKASGETPFNNKYLRFVLAEERSKILVEEVRRKRSTVEHWSLSGWYKTLGELLYHRSCSI